MIQYKTTYIKENEIPNIISFTDEDEVTKCINNKNELLLKLQKVDSQWNNGYIENSFIKEDLSEIKIYFKHHYNLMNDGIELLKRI